MWRTPSFRVLFCSFLSLLFVARNAIGKKKVGKIECSTPIQSNLTAIVHIGPPKTGTTHFQKYLEKNVRGHKFNCHYNFWKLYLPWHVQERMMKGDFKRVEDFLQGAVAQHKHVIFSAEIMGSAHNALDPLFAKGLLRNFSTVKIVWAYRETLNALKSAYSQMAVKVFERSLPPIEAFTGSCLKLPSWVNTSTTPSGSKTRTNSMVSTIQQFNRSSSSFIDYQNHREEGKEKSKGNDHGGNNINSDFPDGYRRRELRTAKTPDQGCLSGLHRQNEVLLSYATVFGADAIHVLDYYGMQAAGVDIVRVILCEIAGIFCSETEIFLGHKQGQDDLIAKKQHNISGSLSSLSSSGGNGSGAEGADDDSGGISGESSHFDQNLSNELQYRPFIEEVFRIAKSTAADSVASASSSAPNSSVPTSKIVDADTANLSPILTSSAVTSRAATDANTDSGPSNGRNCIAVLNAASTQNIAYQRISKKIQPLEGMFAFRTTMMEEFVRGAERIDANLFNSLHAAGVVNIYYRNASTNAEMRNRVRFEEIDIDASLRNATVKVFLDGEVLSVLKWFC